MGKNVNLHHSTGRLYMAAMEMKGIQGQSAVARLLNESPQRVKNWEARGVSKTGALLAEQVIGCSALWILTGRGGMKKNHGAQPGAPVLAMEPVKQYHMAPPQAWPFISLTSADYGTLTNAEKARVESFIRFIMHEKSTGNA